MRIGFRRVRRKPELRWEMIYINLVTLLMILFLVFYAQGLRSKVVGSEASYEQALQTIQRAFGGAAAGPGWSPASARDREVVAAKGLEAAVRRRVAVTRERISLSLPADLLFDRASAVLDGGSRDVLSDLGRQLLEFPANDVLIEAWTDEMSAGGEERYESNVELSSYRAIAALRVFEEAGVAATRLTAVGYGRPRRLEDGGCGGPAPGRCVDVIIARAKG